MVDEEERAYCIRVVNEVTAPGVNYRPMSAVIQEQRALAREQGVASVRAKFEVVGAVNQKLMAKLAAIEALSVECGNVCGVAMKLRKILGGEL